MIDLKDFNFFDNQNQNNFDFKGFLIKIVSYWKWFVLCWIICFTVAYQVNIRKQKIYSVETSISVKEESNPFFTSTTSLVFNWGGTSDQIQTIISTLRSRSHNEMVVDRLNFYINYLKEDKYNRVDAYGEAPFTVTIDKKRGQLLDRDIKIKFISEHQYQISVPFDKENAETVSLYNYSEGKISTTPVSKGVFEKIVPINEPIDLPFLNWKLELKEAASAYIGSEWLVSFSNFDRKVSSYQGITIDADAKGGSILKLSLQGNNKARMVDYLNTTVEILRQNQLAAKNQFATNTIAFIDSTMQAMQGEIRATGDEMKLFVRNKNIVQLEEGGSEISAQLLEYDSKKNELLRKNAYYNSLQSYLNNSTDFSKLPAPAVVGIEDPNIVMNVSKLISLSTQRSEMAYTIKSEKIFKDFDNQMDAVKSVLLENIKSAKSIVRFELNSITAQVNKAESSIKKLPTDKQEFLKIKRKFDLSDNIYNTFLQKRSEANIVKAANVSDIKFIDTAKDTGGGLIGPKTSVNYILALFVGFLIPFLIILALFFMNNSIQKVEEIERITKLPLIGIVGKKVTASNLAVFEKPKSALSESFRAIRSSLQFLYRKNSIEGAKTLMLTSTISGEGKTFCSLNIATVFALSEKKTIILGLDLRKPKLFDDLNVDNEVGIVDYLIQQKKLSEIVKKTPIPYLDIITSGAIPPNPSELIMSDSMKDLLKELKSKYDYIILDTPPVGLVTDAMELANFCDVIIYVVRQNYTKKDMLSVLNSRVQSGELKNVSILLNGFENKAKYGYGNNYGYGYGSYANGYHEVDKPKNKIGTFLSNYFKKTV
jgi:polysaccharide biosynthesis transport protein